MTEPHSHAPTESVYYLPVVPRECVVGGMNWPVCALGIVNHDECYEVTTGHPKRYYDRDTAMVLAHDRRVRPVRVEVSDAIG